jgi:HD-GYP domain-containing protein (c-di-GMP phosphodiesterase class II)
METVRLNATVPHPVEAGAMQPGCGDYSRDPLDAIFALNIGDFSPHADAQQLCAQLRHRQPDDPSHLRRQIEELVDYYSFEKSLQALGFSPNPRGVALDTLASAMTSFFEATACHIFHRVTVQQSQLVLVGSAPANPSHALGNAPVQLALRPHTQQEAYHQALMSSQPMVFTPPAWLPIPTFQTGAVETVLTMSLAQGRLPVGLVVLDYAVPRTFSSPFLKLAQATAHLLETSIQLEQCLGEAQQLLHPEAYLTTGFERRSASRHRNDLQGLRARITEGIANLGLQQHRFLRALAGATDERLGYPQGHTQQVAKTAQRLAQALGCDEPTTECIYHAGLLCTLGRWRMPATLLAKREQLTPDERRQLQEATSLAASVLNQIYFLADVAPALEAMAERWDGSGGPAGLTGEDIPLGARILAVAEAFHALQHPRPYRQQAYTAAEALALLNAEADQKWDRSILDALA